MKKTPQVAIIMGSQTDLNIMIEATKALEEFKISSMVKIVSAHRTPEDMYEFAKTAHEKGIEVIIAGAGGAAHLPGMVACLTVLPVIGVPISVGKLKGLDALLSIAQMPKGVPVATVAVDNAYNAGLLAIRILSLKNTDLMSKIKAYQSKQKINVKKMNLSLKKK